MNKGFAAPLVVAIGALVIAIVAGVIGYSLKPTQKAQSSPSVMLTPMPTSSPVDETAKWKTYTNKEFNYEVKYPASWYAAGPYGGQAGYDCLENPQGVTIIEFSKIELTDCGFAADQLPPAEADVTIWVLNKPFTTDEIPTKNALGEDVSKRITIAGEEATKIAFTEKAERPNIQATRIYFNHAGRGYLIFLKQTDKKGNYDPIFDQILSTFKFLD